MDIDRFLVENRPAWDRLATLTRQARRGARQLDDAQLDELLVLYQRASAHLSYARTALRDPALVGQLSGLVARAGAVVHGTRPRTSRAVGRFVVETFPAGLWHVRRFVLVATLLSVLSAAAVGGWIANSPRALDASAPAAVREAYVQHDFEHYYSAEPSAAFASKVFTNNVRVGILAFAAGILLCVVTVFILVQNAANLGFAAGLFAAAGQLPKFWGLVLPHGLLELTAVFVAGGTGLAIGWTVIDPGDRPRGRALAEEGRRAFAVVIGLIGVFAAAGTIEGFVTGSTLPTAARVGIGVAGEVAFLAYWWVLGRRAAAKGLTGAIGEREVPMMSVT